jgi:RNase P subunit RPR2
MALPKPIEKLPRNMYPICPKCNRQMIVGAHMTSDNSRHIYCTSESCNYSVRFEQLTSPLPPT